MTKRIALLTLHDEGYQPLADVTMPGKQEYCDRHGYVLVTAKDFPHIDPKNTWLRLPCTLELLEAGFDAVMWIDCDVMIMNHEIRVEDRLQEHKLVISADFNGVCAGTYIAAKHPQTIQYFFVLANTGPKISYEYNMREQGAMAMLLYRHPYLDLATILPQRSMNSYAERYVKGIRQPTHDGIWQPGDWMIHFVAGPLSHRIPLAQAYLAHVQK